MNSDLTFAESLIEQFRKRRYELGVSQPVIDEKIGVAPGLVAKWETGNRKPTAFNLHCWAEALGCKIKLEVQNEDMRY
ncbi:helix-turn-helix domain-containing protein [Alphaproteobacteria bacterium]|jgi:transcriptional regulator with XRE-family HTH domain|nr:helix-turn-helix domain-containing protein [Alphaproteobacteria bacterium]|tara:strand:- start:502 stop:735 length:234 start_codon:yes stop_codon:yes gene_type:complete